VSYRWVRMFLTLLGLGALAGFGLSFSDFVKNKDSYLAAFDPRRLQSSIKEYAADKNFGHLKAHDPHFLVLDLPAASGWMKSLALGPGNKPPPPPLPKVGPNHVVVSMIQYSANKEFSFAYLRPVGMQGAESRYVGDFYRVGQVFQLEGKEGLDLEIKVIRPQEIEIGIVNDTYSFVIQPAQADQGESDRVRVIAADGTETASDNVPTQTMETSPGTFALGSEDLKEIGDMPEDELYASVPVAPARDAIGAVRGLRLKSVEPGSVFSRLGLKTGDIVLEVNGFQTKDRAAVMRFLQNQPGGQILHLTIERRGGVRYLTYRLPR